MVAVGPVKVPTTAQLVGFDINSTAVRFANASAHRLGLPDSLVKFVCAPAGDAVEWAEHEPSSCPLSFLLQFPTPFKVAVPVVGDGQQRNAEVGAHPDGDFGGNSQLPDDDDGFMANVRLVDSAVRAMRRRPGGFLFLQSNVEDVAVAMRNRVRHAEHNAMRSKRLQKGPKKPAWPYCLNCSFSGTKCRRPIFAGGWN